MNDFFSAVSQFGFPIVVAAYLLFRFENKLDLIGTKIDRFSDILEGKPSEGKTGLIEAIKKNTEVTTNLVTAMKRRKRS